MKRVALFLSLVPGWYLSGADLVQHVQKHTAGEVAYSLDSSAFEKDTRDLPIGVFDSGIGGLTVLEAILKLDAYHNDSLQPGADGRPDFQNERFQYLGDQANMPYGNYSNADRTDYLKELILKDAIFLLGKRWYDPINKAFRYDKPPVKALVIACNTATAYGITELREALKVWKLPVLVVGVVEAGARGVLSVHKEGSVGVIATVGTCKTGAYPRVISQTLGLAGRSAPVITQYGSADLAAVIEGSAAVRLTVPEQAQLDVAALLADHPQDKPELKTVVLGCTHFPLVEKELRVAFSKAGKEVVFVNPAEWTAKELFRELARARLRAERRVSEHQFYLSVVNPTRTDLALTSEGGLIDKIKYGRSAGNLEVEDTVNVPMTVERIPSSSRQLIEEMLPTVWQCLTR